MNTPPSPPPMASATFVRATCWRWGLNSLKFFLMIGLWLLMALLVLVQWEPGLDWLTGFVEQTTRKPGFELRLSGLRGIMDGKVRLAQLTLADASGVWLIVEGVRVEFSLSGLLRGEANVSLVRAESVRMVRRPQSAASSPAPPPPSPASTPMGEEWPLPPVLVEHLEVGQWIMGAAILGQEVGFHLRGGVQWPADAPLLNAKLHLDPLEPSGPRFALDASLDTRSRQLTIDLHAVDEGKLLVPWLGPGRAQLTLQGTGPADHWNGELQAELGALGTFSSAVELAALQRPTVALAGQFTPGASRDSALAFAVQAEIDPHKQELNSTATVRVAQLKNFSTLAGITLTGGGTLDIQAAGHWSQPQVHLTLGLDAAQVGAVALDSVAMTFTATPMAGAHGGWGLTGTSAARGLMVGAGITLPDLVWLELELEQPAPQSIQLKTVRLHGDGAELELRGGVDLLQGAGDLDLTSRLTREATWVPGRAAIPTEQVGLTAKISLSKQFRQLSTRYQGWGEALFQASGQLDWDRDRDYVNATLHGELPQLALFAPLVKTAMSGKLVVDATARGASRAPECTLLVQGKALDLAGVPLESLRLQAAATNLDSRPEGPVTLTAQRGGQPITLAANYVAQDSQLALSALQVRLPQGELNGAMTLQQHPTPLLTGTLHGTITELAGVDQWLSQTVHGAVQVEITLLPQKTKQAATIALQGNGLAGPFGTVEAVQLKAEGRDLLGVPSLEAEVTARQFQHATLVVEQATLKATGTLAGLELETALAGRQRESFTVRSTARLEQDKSTRLLLRTLSGQWGKEALRLKKSGQLILHGAEMTLEPLEITFGQAHLELAASANRKTVTGTVRLDSPLSMVTRLGGPELTGQGHLRGQVTGSPRHPKAELELHLEQAVIQPQDLGAFPPADIRLHAELDDQGARGRGELSGSDWRRLTVQGAVPASFSMAPLVLALQPTAELTGTVQGAVDLAPLFLTLGLDEQMLEGLATMDLTLSGTVASPQLHGTASLAKGRYEHGATGTVLRDLQMAARFQDGKLWLDSLSALDGETGELEASGWLGLDPHGGFPFVLNSQLRHATLLRRDDLTARLSGALRFQGDVGHADLYSRLVAEKVNIQIPETQGVGIDVVEVVERNAKLQAATSQAAAEPSVIKLDVELEIPEQMYVRGRGLESEWAGQLAVLGTATAPEVRGQLNVQRGALDLLGQRLTIRKGVVSFTGDTPPKPRLLVEGEAKRTNMTALVVLEGTVDDLKMSMSSEPELPHDEVISGLLFDRHASQLSPIQALMLARTVQQLKGGGGPDLLGKARELLQVDSLDVADNGTESSSVVIRKHLKEDLVLELERGLTDSKATVELELTPNLQLKTTLQEEGQGVGVFWKNDY